MAQQIQYLINDPGTNNIYNVVLDEASKTEVTNQIRASEIVQAAITQFPNDIDVAMHNTMSLADITTLANLAAQDMKTAGYI